MKLSEEKRSVKLQGSSLLASKDDPCNVFFPLMTRNNFWWKEAVIYEVYVDKFAKNFRGITEKLSYLKNLGINCLWLLPHYPSPMIDDGYDVSDYFGVRKELGTLNDFRQFTKQAHKAGIRVIIDFVLNHVSIEHPWFREAFRSKESPKRDFFIWSKTGKEFPQAINPFSHMKPSNWVYNPVAEDYYFATFYSQQADLNWDNTTVFQEMMKVIDFWIDNGVDGFRLDAAPFLIKREGTQCANLPETHQVIKNIRAHVEKQNQEVILLAEANGPLNLVKEYFGSTSFDSAQDKSLTTGGGDECHMAFNFHLMTAMLLTLKRGNNSIAEKTAKETADIPQNCQWATFLRNHDELTLEHVAEAERNELLPWLDSDSKYSFKEGHGASVRLATIFNGNKNKILEAFKLLFGLSGLSRAESKGSPVIYYGDEIGMENAKFLEKPADTRRYVRGEFDWPEAEKQLKDPNSMLNQVAKLIKSRR